MLNNMVLSLSIGLPHQQPRVNGLAHTGLVRASALVPAKHPCPKFMCCFPRPLYSSYRNYKYFFPAAYTLCLKMGLLTSMLTR